MNITNITTIKQNISHIGDLIAIPFFCLLIYYFYNKREKTIIENILFLFSIGGLIADLLFTFFFLKKYKILQ
jgi:hypothetical protein